MKYGENEKVKQKGKNHECKKSCKIPGQTTKFNFPCELAANRNKKGNIVGEAHKTIRVHGVVIQYLTIYACRYTLLVFFSFRVKGDFINQIRLQDAPIPIPET
jgi:hypothetical protein